MKKSLAKPVNINRNSVLYFNIGLSVTLLLVVLAFEYKTPMPKEIMNKTPILDVFEVIDIPITNQKPPPAPPPAKKRVFLVPVSGTNSQEAEHKIQPAREIIIPEKQGFTLVPEDIPEEETDDPLIIAEVMPAYEGGLKAFYAYVQQNLRYPGKARRMGIEGRVIIEFVIGKNGEISEARVLQGIGAGCDEEALRVVTAATGWHPGKQRGKLVKVRMALPITFKLR